MLYRQWLIGLGCVALLVLLLRTSPSIYRSLSISLTGAHYTTRSRAIGSTARVRVGQPATGDEDKEPITGDEDEQPTTEGDAGNQGEPFTGDRGKPTTGANQGEEPATGSKVKPPTGGNEGEESATGNQGRPSTARNEDGHSSAGSEGRRPKESEDTGVATEDKTEQKTITNNKDISNTKQDNVFAALKKSPEVKVVLVTYMRSGSTFLGELFNYNPDAFFLYEPLDGVYNSLYGNEIGWNAEDLFYFTNKTLRTIPEFERTTVATSIKDLLNCDLTQLPVEVWLHSFAFTHVHHQLKLRDYVTCMKVREKVSYESSLKCRKLLKCSGTFDRYESPYDCYERLHPTSSVSDQPEVFKTYAQCVASDGAHARKCLQKTTSACQQSSIRCIKTIRFSMDIMDELLEIAPDIKVIHYMRDPRGLAHSRMAAGLLSAVSKKHMREDAKLYCHRVTHDLSIRQSLEKKYPNTFMQLLYEDLAEDPDAVSKKIYYFLGAPLSPEVKKWIYTSAHASENDGVYGTSRSDPRKTAFKWREKLTVGMIGTISEACTEMLNFLGYPMS